MSRAQRTLCIFYALVAVLALFATWSQNLAYLSGASPAGMLKAYVSFANDTRANPASRSITVDIGFLLLAAAAFMVLEARRLGVRYVWAYIVLGFLIAISVTFPLFMIAREARLAAEPGRGAGWQLKASDLAGLAIVTAVVLGLGWYVLR